MSFFEALESVRTEDIKNLSESEALKLFELLPIYNVGETPAERRVPQPWPNEVLNAKVTAFLQRCESLKAAGSEEMKLAMFGRFLSNTSTQGAVANLHAPGTVSYRISWTGGSVIDDFIPRERGGDGNTFTFDLGPTCSAHHIRLDTFRRIGCLAASR